MHHFIRSLTFDKMQYNESVLIPGNNLLGTQEKLHLKIGITCSGFKGSEIIRGAHNFFSGGGGGERDFFPSRCARTRRHRSYAVRETGSREELPRHVETEMTCCWLETINIISVKYAKARSNTSGITHCWLFSCMRTCVPVMCTPGNNPFLGYGRGSSPPPPPPPPIQ